MIIDTSYFFGDLYIPQVTETFVSNSVNKYIAKYEPEFLQKIFGYEMAKSVSANNYPAIIDGVEFQNIYQANQLTKWVGLKVDIGGGKFASIIANYVYAKYMIDNMSYSTGSGEKVIEQATSQTVSPAAKISRAWNEITQQLPVLISLMQSDRVTYAAYNSYNTDRFLLTRMNPFGI